MEQSTVQLKPEQNPLHSYSSALSYYKPLTEGKIEEITEKPFSFGNIGVKVLSHLEEDFIDSLTREAVFKSFYPHPFSGVIKLPFLYFSYRSFEKRLKGLAQKRRKKVEKLKVPLYFRKTVYIPDSASTCSYDIHKNTLHELGHALWEILGGEDFNLTMASWSQEQIDNLNYYAEGFATYCGRLLFAEFLSSEYAQRLNREPIPEPHLTGLEKICDILERHSNTIYSTLLKIPRKWKEFER